MAGIIKGLVSDGTLPTSAKQNLAADLGNPSSTVGAAVQSRLTAERTASDAKYLQGSPDLVTPLPNPFIVSHRGGPLAAPEGTMEAFRINSATGVHVLEADIQPTGDGALVVMHDVTVDRTTDGTGPVSDYTLPAFMTLNGSADIPWPNPTSIPTLKQFLAEFGPQHALMLEAKDSSTLQQMLDEAEKAGVKNSVLVETDKLADAQAAIARGYQVWLYWGTSASQASVDAAVAAGVQHLAAAFPINDENLARLVNTGKPVTVYSIHRRTYRDEYLAKGVKGISSDQPTYVMQDKAFTKKDSWRLGMWGHGLGSNRGVLPPIENGAITLGMHDLAEIIVPGEVCPVAAASGSGTYSIDVDLGWKTLPSDLTRALQVQFCLPNDREYNYGSATTVNGYPNGYQLHLRVNGNLELYKLNAPGAGVNGGSTKIGATITTGALTAGALAHAKITVTPTGISVARTDAGSADTTAISVADTAFRGGYINLTRFSTADGVGQFKNLVIS